MSMETLTFESELTKLDETKRELCECEKELEEMILSSRFQTERNQFQLLLGNFLRNVITIVDLTQIPVPWAPMPEKEAAQKEAEDETEKEWEFSLPKAVVVAVAILACTVAVYHNLVPSIVLIGVTSSSIALMFLPQIRSVIASLHREEVEEEPTAGVKVAKRVSDSIEEMSKKYTSARFLTKVQDQTKETLPYYSGLGIDEALYNRAKYFDETLPDEFLARIRKIMVECNEAIWLRKSLIISAMSAAAAAQAKVT